MSVEEILLHGYEKVVKFTKGDDTVFISVHSTKRGPALGGCRALPYATDEEALSDVLKLSEI